jgi:predicted protein tyrosine phosphatase
LFAAETVFGVPRQKQFFLRWTDLKLCLREQVLNAGNPISPDLLAWADIIFVMENIHRRKPNERFGPILKKKRLIVLGIPDQYRYMDPELVRVLKVKVSHYIKPER